MSREWKPGDLVVIDPDNGEAVERLLYLARNNDSIGTQSMQAALREFALTAEEPTGLGAVVQDMEDALWVRHEVRGGGGRWCGVEGITRHYADIDVVRVLSKGVQP